MFVILKLIHHSGTIVDQQYKTLIVRHRCVQKLPKYGLRCYRGCFTKASGIMQTIHVAVNLAVELITI